MIFNALSGSSGLVKVGGNIYNVLHSMGVAGVYRANQANSTSLEKAPQLHNGWHPRVL